MLPLVDCHTHLDLLPDADEAVDAAVSAGVEAMIAVGIDLQSSEKATAYAERHDRVHAAVGIHPHSAAAVTGATMERLAEIAGNSQVKAIGETGLDYYRDRSPREVQMDCFLSHIRLARDLKMPLIVHSREATEDTLAVLDSEAVGVTIILHCFAMADRVRECAERSYFMSLAGNVTFSKAAALREAAAVIPPDLLLTETDAPYLAPVPFRGRQNTPAYVGHTLDEIARLRNIAPDRLAQTVRQNFSRAFRI